MKYAVLFRGINVGGKNIVKMNDLKQLFFDLGFKNPETYIQSGNAVFEADLEEKPLQEIIEEGFSKQFGFKSSVTIRNIDEISSLIEHLPFSQEEISEAEAADPTVEHLYVYFLENPPERSKIEALCKNCTDSDIIRTGKREIYLLCKQSIRKSKAAAQLSKLFMSSTARNWKTVNKLHEML
ncbi:DUF1697 domain-containing protein [Anaeropeptidivorans aminofermentans]|jgi:uncharacterized protein (DUF1697 family)|uniref:DUF1697 domain-containing protein n=1 Tax=Anaeropeptidivorans aminofermentans TaxID=2934315 RepID=UPI0020242641|nr:DUF1697 domain-containing protein [Anaeropeptidivorans aminofermentans]